MEGNIKSLLGEAVGQLRGLGEGARLDAEVLLAHCLGVPRSHLHAWPEKQVAPQVGEALAEKLARRARGEPLAYLVGHKEFWSLTLKVSPETLIPRPETELLVSEALARCPQGACILELGTGSGAIAIALGHERPDARIIATDSSAGALAIATDNARQHRVLNIRFEAAGNGADWFGVVDGRRFDLVISNPPYVADDDPGFSTGEIRYEPRTALAAGADGLRDLSRIIAAAPNYLVAGGCLLLEHGCGQAGAVSRMMQEAGFAGVTTLPDLAGLARVTRGRTAHR